MRPIVFQTEARRDALEAFEWYEEQRPGLGRHFREALHATLVRLSLNPEGYAASKRGLRRALVQRFPYAVYFRILENTVVIVGVMHGRRHPSVVKAR